MPTLSAFYGIIIKMYWDEHPPPHFHAKYGEYEAQSVSKRLKSSTEDFLGARPYW